MNIFITKLYTSQNMKNLKYISKSEVTSDILGDE
jgi:hypothetical protein